MNLIRKQNRFVNLCGKLLHRRSIETTPSTEHKLVLESLPERGIIRVKGDEIVPFLQGLITNDIKHLHPSSNKAIYAMFLNKAGRVLYDVILYSTREPTQMLIECDKNIINELERHLKLYRVRRKIEIDSLPQEYKVWQAFDPTKQHETIKNSITKKETPELILSSDPRLKCLGLRMLAKSDKEFLEISTCFKQNAVCEPSEKINFRLHRYMLGIAEGISDMPPGKCFPLEANCDILNGVSFHKGCYIGQELTARVHHTGMIRKRHMPVKLTEMLTGEKTSVVQNELGANCGTIYGSLANHALGLLRVESAIKAKKLFVNGAECFTERPPWWPKELHSNILKVIQKEI